MEITSMLCVGRGRLSRFGQTHLSESRFYTPERKYSAEMNNSSGLTEKELVERVSSKLSRECLSPPTKSILRGRVPSPKQGSPSSLRSVRFSDKESEDEIMYAKIHVNKNIQTEHVHREKRHKETGSGQVIKLDLAQNHEDFNQKGVHEMKTSTPRYNAHDQTPMLDFHASTGPQEDCKRPQKSITQDTVSSQRENHMESSQTKQKSDIKHERIVFDIDIARKGTPELKRRNAKTYESRGKRNYYDQGNQEASGKLSLKNGSQIIKNMDLNRTLSKSPERKRPIVPDGNRIIQNMELDNEDLEGRMRSIASQTSCSDISSPRSASPETPNESINIPDGRGIIKNMELHKHDFGSKTKSVQTTQIQDGGKIIQNLEFKSRNSSFKTSSEPLQANDILYERKLTQKMEPMRKAEGKNHYTSVGVQTFDENEDVRSVPVQTDFNISEDNFSNDSIDFSDSRSIAVQTQTISEPNIPDGSMITRNMEIHKSEKTKLMDGRDDRKGLNDSNWNEFVRHLELFNPSHSSSSSSSVSEEEIQTTQPPEPILVYDRNAPSPETVKNSASVTEKGKSESEQRISNRSAKTFLKSEEYTRHQYESILREEGLLRKQDTSSNSTADPSVRAKLMVEKAFAKNEGQFGKSKNRDSEPTLSKGRTEQIGNQQANRKEQIQVSRYYKEMNRNTQHYQQQTKPDKDNLGFTPIETYSFKPETLTNTAAKRECISSKPIVTALKTQNETSTLGMNICSAHSTKESVTKNSFVQGLDLGPVPITSQRYPSLLSSRIMSDRPATYQCSRSGEGLREDNTFYPQYGTNYGKGLSERPKFQDSFLSSTIGNSPASFAAKHLPQRASLYGSQSSGYSHASSKASIQDFRSSLGLSRPASAHIARNRHSPGSSPLSSTLRDMRNNALRKNAMNQFADQRRRSSAFAKSYSFSAPSSRSLVADQSPMYPNSSKFSMHGYQRSHENTKSYTPFSRSSVCSKGISRNILSNNTSSERSDYMYLSALNDHSNARPPSRERSRSRSRSPELTSTIAFGQSDVLRRSNQQTTTLNLNNSTRYKADETNRCNKITEDSGSFDSTASSGFKQSFSMTPRVDASLRESRPLTRKPPLPKTPRSSSNGRSRSSSTDSFSRTRVKQRKERKQESQRKSSLNAEKPNPHKRGNKTPEPDKSGLDECLSDSRTVTIGAVPTGLVDQECMFLSHDTIQKIIEEAKL